MYVINNQGKVNKNKIISVDFASLAFSLTL